VGDRGIESPIPGVGGTVSHKMFQFSGSPKRYFIHFDTFYDNLTAADLVYFIYLFILPHLFYCGPDK
jgi:hypothetical protein